MMKTVISADSHVCEPPNCYVDNIQARFKARAPRVSHSEKLGDIFIIDGSNTPVPLALAASAGKSPEELDPKGATFENLHRGGWEPHARVRDQDKDGISAEIIYPSVGMEICNVSDLEFKQACMEAYNRWLVKFCAPFPERLIGLGQCAVKTPQSGIDELRSIKKQGFKGVMLPGWPGELDYNDPSYSEFFEAIVELELVASFHILTSRETREKNRGSKINSFMSIVRGNQDLISMFILDGILSRHPKLKIVSVEADGGWIPHFMYRLDHAYNRHRHWMKGLELDRSPSDIFKDQVYFTFQDDKTAFLFKDHMNIERMMWANDFPHSDSTWPRSKALLKEQMASLTDEEKNLVVHHNVTNLYGL